MGTADPGEFPRSSSNITVIQILPGDPLFPSGYVLVEQFEDGQIHVALRQESWDTWSVGGWGVIGSVAR